MNLTTIICYTGKWPEKPPLGLASICIVLLKNVWLTLLQTSEEIKSNSLDTELKKKEVELMQEKQEKTDQEEVT